MAFGISFRRTFKHTPWIDAVDRVSAAGDNGFNIRFRRLEEDLDTIGQRFEAVSTALDSLAATEAAVRTIALAPLLTPIGESGWDLATTPGTALLKGDGTAKGAMPVPLPEAGRIVGFQAFGTIVQTPASVRIDLTRRALDGSGEKLIARIQASSSEEFREKVPNSEAAGIDPQAGYYIIASVNGTGLNTSVMLTGFRVRYEER
ncbi:hypothetical protein [Streptomyces sp. MMG1533]|uniref:hypothetical protein n=1 Tax=Streptomyces sp. MMG1533 TaxID=1415546 RepID=UPI00131B52BD|nr:hypothetical protein [Streptomyces sp. MMG1533]